MEHLNYNVKMKLVLEGCSLSRSDIIRIQASALALASTKQCLYSALALISGTNIYH